jgi:glucokinase-like ROK family protein
MTTLDGGAPRRLSLPEGQSVDLRLVLARLRDRGPQAVSELSEELNVSRSKIDRDVAELVRLDLVRRGGPTPSTGGRPSRIVGLSPTLHFLGVDIGATSLAVGLTNGYLEVADFVEEASDVRRGPEPVIERTIALITKLTKSIDRRTVIGIGVGVPGPVSFRDGKPVAPPIMPGWDAWPVRDILSQRLGLPVTVDNDVNIMALGERHAGVARGVADLLFVKIGTGIGCGIISRGAIHRGVNGCAGDIGHIRVRESTTLCHCGRTGCLESEFGGAALARRATAAGRSGESLFLNEVLTEKGELTAEDVGRASVAGDPVSTQLIRDGGQLLGQVLSGLVNFFNPLMIVVGGGLSKLGHLLIAEIRSVTFNRSTPLATSSLSIVASELGGQAGVIGAAFLASETFLGTVWQA